ncbi:helix-turn-helix domain-containing protein [Mycobacterium sp. URHB0044]|uniref:winged helix-turn-helix transcriptional regulator n=1 Tax=Mycobacterium sp. URHB0044 TaxID=1380386 RepID=UPI00048C353B|nr:helix-turn-helix domain-containing protein [Mycobacterium sp. URHB0044]
MIPAVAVRKTYNQNCPVALGLDILGERWTLLILRELVGGSRRYSDLRAELPGIATNLLAERLRALEEAGLIQRTDMPPPIARTVYELSDAGWCKFTPVLQAIANFGIDQFDADNAVRTPLGGFLVGLLMGFDPSRAADIRASYRVRVDERTFDFSIDRGELAAGRDALAVTVEATAADLITARLAPTAARRQAAMRRIRFDGAGDAVAELQQAFQLSA